MDTINGEVKMHESAGGVVFYLSPTEKTLWVALVQKQNLQYFLPKGHLKSGESPYEAAIREIKEELTLEDDLRLIGELGTQSYTCSSICLFFKKEITNWAEGRGKLYRSKMGEI